MDFRVNMTGLNEGLAGAEADIAASVSAAVREATQLLQDEARRQVEEAGLGTRLARTWRRQVFPTTRDSVDAAGWIYTKAPKLIDVFDRGATIVPLGGRRYLAIPTENVPLKRRRRMTPLEVEAAFNQDLIIRQNAKGTVLGFVNVLQSRNLRGFRRATARRLAQGRGLKLVLMFVFVRQAVLRKRLNLAALEAPALARWPGLLAKHWRA